MSHLRHGRPHRIHGWGLIKTRGARLAQRRYMRLIHHTLTVFDAADEDADLVIFEEILVGAQVNLIRRRREIVVKFPTDKFSVVLRTDKEFEAWSRAFVDSARVAENFYTLVLSRKLGVGAFSTVFFGFDRENGDHVAIKVVDKTKCSRAELIYAETEARMMAYVQHPSIVLCRDIFDAPHSMHVVMEYMSGNTLEQRMLSMDPDARMFSEKTAATIMSHILDALSYLEAEGICHRDVKPENILLSSLTNDSLWATSARLSDFGLAAFIDTDLDLTDIVGTPHYVAPEVISRDQTDNERLGYGRPVDVWASGIVMFWMLSGGKLPFDGSDSANIFKSIRCASLELDMEPWVSISSDAKSFLRSLLHPSPNTRLKSSAARTHRWLLRGHKPLAVAQWAWCYENRAKRRQVMNGKARLRSAVRAVMACNLLWDVVHDNLVAEEKILRSERWKKYGVGKKESLESKMQKAPERAPVGADGLGYNVGLIPSFAPKRRAKAGVVSAHGPREGIGGGNGERRHSLRISRESASSSGSRGGSGEREGGRDGSIDKCSAGGGGKGSSWGLQRRGRRSLEKVSR